MKIVQVVHTEKEEEEKNKNKQTTEQTHTHTNTNLRHTQCVNNEIHIGGRQDRAEIDTDTSASLLLTSRRSLITLAVVGRRYTISHIFHVNTVQIRQTHIQSRTTQLSKKL